MSKYQIVISHKTYLKAINYLKEISYSPQIMGRYLSQALKGKNIVNLTNDEFLGALVNTKKPQIFAESFVFGDSSDWNLMELSILGDIGISANVIIYDDGKHFTPSIHDKPFKGTLLFIPGALLVNYQGNTPADWTDIVINNEINSQEYFTLYERRLVPMLIHANNQAFKNNNYAVITIPGLGCGQFAGQFKGQLGNLLKQAIKYILEKHSSKLSNIKMVYYDPFSECKNETLKIGAITFLIRPLMQNDHDKPQLCMPYRYINCIDNLELFSFVAWDHVSWPGNDFYTGSRSTDDGVKAAATDSMFTMTGIQGNYNKEKYMYDPPSGYKNWEDVIYGNNIKIKVEENTFIYDF